MFVNSVGIVAAAGPRKNQTIAATVACVTQVDQDHIVMSIPLEAVVTDAIVTGEHFSISVLGSAQSDLARYYGGHNRFRRTYLKDTDVDLTTCTMPTVKNSCKQSVYLVIKKMLLSEQVIVLAKLIETEVNRNHQPLTSRSADYAEIVQ